MKFGDDLYGWGVYDIPMERASRSGGSAAKKGLLKAEPTRKLLQDVSWRILGSSVLLTLLCLAGLLFLARNPPELPVPSEPQPVEVAVRIFEEVPRINPPEVAVLPLPPPEESAVKIPEDPPPISEEPRVTPPPEPERTVRAAPAKPPEPIRIQPSPTNLRIPPPASLRPAPSEPPQEPPALPDQKPRVVARQEAVLPAPPRTTYKQRSDPASANLSERTAALKKEAASIDLGPGPQWARSAERGTSEGALPEKPAIALERSYGTDLGGATPRMNARYANIDGSPDMPLPVPRKTVASNGGGDADMLPKATAFAAPGTRKAVAMLPPGDPRDSSFSSIVRKADPDITGPAVQTASLPQDPRTTDAPGKTFDFLDLVGPGDLDPTVMVSLNQLRTCLDPQEEQTLKTRLAAMLSRPGQCRSGGVVFDIRQPESAYSIHIDLYNYEHREFQDRCAALRLAVYACEARR